MAVGVEVRGVDEVAAAVEVGRQDLLRLLDAAAGAAGVLAEGHRAERERADPQAGAAEGDVVVEWHGILLGCRNDYSMEPRTPSTVDRSTRPLARSARFARIVLAGTEPVLACGVRTAPTSSSRSATPSRPRRPDMRRRSTDCCCPKWTPSEPHHSLTEPLLVVMAQGGKRLLLGEQVYEYRAGQCLLVTADLPVTGHFVGATPETPALGVGLVLRPAAIAPLLLEAPARRGLAHAAGAADRDRRRGRGPARRRRPAGAAARPPRRRARCSPR